MTCWSGSARRCRRPACTSCATSARCRVITLGAPKSPPLPRRSQASSHSLRPPAISKGCPWHHPTLTRLAPAEPAGAGSSGMCSSPTSSTAAAARRPCAGSRPPPPPWHLSAAGQVCPRAAFSPSVSVARQRRLASPASPSRAQPAELVDTSRRPMLAFSLSDRRRPRPPRPQCELDPVSPGLTSATLSLTLDPPHRPSRVWRVPGSRCSGSPACRHRGPAAPHFTGAPARRSCLRC